MGGWAGKQAGAAQGQKSIFVSVFASKIFFKGVLERTLYWISRPRTHGLTVYQSVRPSVGVPQVRRTVFPFSR